MMFISLISFLTAFIGTYYVMPHSIRKLKQRGYVATDMYKENKPEIATNAGIIVLFISYITISFIPVYSRVLSFVGLGEERFYDLDELNFAFLLVVSIFALYGLVDDLVDIGRKMKLFFPIAFSFPLITVISPDFIWLPFAGNISLSGDLVVGITLNDLFRFTIIPIYVMVVSNLVNMHSGYNGLQSGLSILLLATLCIKLFSTSNTQMLPIALTFLGSMIAFWFFNFFPAKVFEGNIGSLLFGSILGSLIAVEELWWFGFFILIPHTFNFALWILWIYLMIKDPLGYTNVEGSHSKFGSLNSDGTIKVPNRLTLKWIPNYYFNLSERDSTLFSYSITSTFCILALVFF